MALAVAGNRQCRSRDVRTRSMVDRRSPFRVEACRSSAPQTQLDPSLANYPNNRISWLKRGLLLASQEASICPDLGLCAKGTLSDNPLIDGTKGSNPSANQH